jgi:hypothetical protein
MRMLVLPAVALSVLGFASVAHAQGGMLFFEGDMERGNQAGAPPACVLNNQFLHLEKVVWRVRVRDASGKALDDKGIKGVMVEMPDGQKIQGRYSGHPPRQPTDTFWSVAWIIPEGYPTGTFAPKVVATDLEGKTHTWQPFNVSSSQLIVLDGKIELKKTN